MNNLFVYFLAGNSVISFFGIGGSFRMLEIIYVTVLCKNASKKAVSLSYKYKSEFNA